ncbi:BnaC04g54710D [Brassica napus]|uniref:BnaC04g54710D protein n=1 Tax=Brassica napus TaxID=3708 RepID=A0A078JFR1_BRANA|nr:BnaC04g54710D [Brassica napus]
MRHYEDNTDNLRDFVCTSRIVDFSDFVCTSRIADVGNVVLVTPPQRNEKCSHVIEDDDEYFDPTHTDATQVHGGGATKTGTLSCAHNDETPSGEKTIQQTQPSNRR